MSFERLEVKITVLYTSDNGIYTFSLLERGGPIIIAESFEKGKLKMAKALDAAFAIRNLQYFDDISIFKKIENTRKNRHSKLDYEFVELTAA